MVCILVLTVPSYASPLLQSATPKNTVEGIVVDQNGAAVKGAEITVSAHSFIARGETDASGQFHFNAPQGVIELTVKALGFARVERKLKPATEDITQLRIILAPASITEQLTITATRVKTRLSETAASVVVLDSQGLKTTAAPTLDDALRQVPGFTLFRRSGSRTANPTSQGISLRGLGASGASRAVVLVDGVPLNDPFGGWVYWDRIPRESLSQVEILRGGSSHLYGSAALSGVINVITKPVERNSLSLETSYGNQLTPGASLFLSGRKGGWGASLATEISSTNGYIPVAPTERGLVDTLASSRHSVVTLSLERWFGLYQHAFGAASFFGESRRNGTPLQTNRTHIRQFSLGGELKSRQAGAFSARGYGGTQVLDQNFSAISTDRGSEAPTRMQRVPVQFGGFLSQWSLPVGKLQTLVAGVETQQIRGASDEIAFVNGRPSSLIGAGGRQVALGFYFEDLIKIGSRLFLTAGARFDWWRNYRAVSATRPLTGAGATDTLFPDRTESAFSPQLSAVYKITPHVSLLASGRLAFRAPTLNELYRSFRVGNVLALANETLRAERLTGGEAGARAGTLNERLVVRGTVYWDEITRPIANTTLTITPILITRQRQNLGRTRSRGIEMETEVSPNRFWNLSAGYLFVDATVIQFPTNNALEGLQIPQVARHQFTFQARYAPALATIAFQGRASSSQFDDDQNLFRLGSYFTLDATVSRGIDRSVELFFAAENIFNQRYEIGKTPVTTLGPPILVRAGMRFHLGTR